MMDSFQDNVNILGSSQTMDRKFLDFARKLFENDQSLANASLTI